MPMSPNDMMAAIVRNLPAKTGRSLAQWAALVKREGPKQRKRQFGAIQPSTADRVDLGLVLPGVKAQGRLEATANVGGGRVTHRIALRSPREVDAEVRRWLKEAYDRDAR
jgi:hypothetical protein